MYETATLNSPFFHTFCCWLLLITSHLSILHCGPYPGIPMFEEPFTGRSYGSPRPIRRDSRFSRFPCRRLSIKFGKYHWYFRSHGCSFYWIGISPCTLSVGFDSSVQYRPQIRYMSDKFEMLKQVKETHHFELSQNDKLIKSRKQLIWLTSCIYSWLMFICLCCLYISISIIFQIEMNSNI